jgi:proton-dependent oligopeptide transporter, POT family
MFKGHPKGLYVAFFANMGERFGFYTMMAILVLFLQVKFGLTEGDAGDYYSWFYFGIYALALIGGIIADMTKKYKLIILLGIVIMLGGYAALFMPGLNLNLTLLALFTIAFGNGLFKGNLQAVVGQLYDDPKYSKMRDSAFMLFYMGINVGAFFAPFAATGVRNWWLEKNGFLHDGSLPAQCHQLMADNANGTSIIDRTQFQEWANAVSLNGSVPDINAFAQQYIDLFSRGYNYAFGIAAIAMVISLVVYIMFNRLLPNKEKQVASSTEVNAEKKSALVPALVALAVGALVAFLISFVKDMATGMAFGLFGAFVTWIMMASTKEEKPKVSSLILVFFVVIFFWMSFHQNGLTLTFFARDYIVKEVGPFNNIFFTLPSILSFIAGLAGFFLLFGKDQKRTGKLIGAAMVVAGGALTYYFVSGFQNQNPIAPEVFQSFNPLFIVFLTPLVMGAFTYMNKIQKEPSTPRKIGIGMIIASIGFLVVLVGSIGLMSPHELNGSPVPDSSRIGPQWLISSYLILTIAELFLSPMGLSFVSKVAPVRFQGLMQGGWLLATAVGNKLLFIGSDFWGKIDLWQLWAIFITVCLISAIFIFSIMKRLEKATK